MEKKSIADGILLRALPAGGFKTALVSINMYVPVSRETSALPALAAQLLESGAPLFSDRSELQNELDRLYGAVYGASVSKNGDLREVKMFLIALADDFIPNGSAFNDALALVSRIISSAASAKSIDRDVFAREKRLLAEQMAADRDNKRRYARSRCEEEMCAGEPFGIPRYGTEASLDTVTEKIAADYLAKLFSEAEIRINALGPIDADAIADALGKTFAGIKRAPAKLAYSPLKAAGDTHTVREEQPVKQGKLVMGFRSEKVNFEGESAQMLVFTDMLGGGTHSRLFMNVREKQSLCYYCSASGVRKKGLLFVESGVKTENAEAARDAIMKELGVLVRGEFTDEDLATAKRSLIDTLKTVADDQTSLEGWLSARGISDEVLSPEEYIEKTESVTRDDVQSIAASFALDTVYILASEEKKNG